MFDDMCEGSRWDGSFRIELFLNCLYKAKPEASAPQESVRRIDLASTFDDVGQCGEELACVLGRFWVACERDGEAITNLDVAGLGNYAGELVTLVAIRCRWKIAGLGTLLDAVGLGDAMLLKELVGLFARPCSLMRVGAPCKAEKIANAFEGCWGHGRHPYSVVQDETVDNC